MRALTRNPDKQRELAEEVVEADLDKPETLKTAFEGAHGVFLVTNFWAYGGADELKQATATIRAAMDAGAKHFIWSTLPDAEAINRRQAQRSTLYRQSEDRSGSAGSRVCEPYVRHRAVLLREPCEHDGSAKAGRRVPWLGSSS